MRFDELLAAAKNGDEDAIQALLEMYRPYLRREATVNDQFDEDLYQELGIVLIKCIRGFQMQL